jgi:CxxC motif-containing protein
MKKVEMICIVCPMSCRLVIDVDDAGAVLSVAGNSCNRGDVYARKELTNPTRMLTSTVKISGAIYDRLPVITSSDIPKGMMFEVMKALANVEVVAPVKANDIIVENVCDLGINIIASRSMERVN